MSDYSLVTLNGAVVNDLLRKYKESRDMIEGKSLNKLAGELQALLDRARERHEQSKSTGLDENSLLVQ